MFNSFINYSGQQPIGSLECYVFMQIIDKSKRNYSSSNGLNSTDAGTTKVKIDLAKTDYAIRIDPDNTENTGSYIGLHFDLDQDQVEVLAIPIKNKGSYSNVFKIYDHKYNKNYALKISKSSEKYNSSIQHEIDILNICKNIYLKEYYEFIQCFDIKATFLEERRNDNLLLYNKNEIEYDNEEYSGYIYIEQLEKLWTETTFANKDYKKQKITSQVKQIVSYHSDETFKALQGLMNIDN